MWALEMSGLTEQRHMPAGQLSGGWKQRLSLGCAILHEPPIIFLDEPTSGVDPISRRQFWELIYELSGKGVTIFVTTHYMDEAEYCDRIAMIYRGELIAMGTPETLKRETMREDILEVYCDAPSDAMTVVEELPEVKEAALFGKGLHVAVSSAETGGAAIGKALSAAGIRLERLETIAPSMEDVFVSLIETQDKREEAQQEVTA